MRVCYLKIIRPFLTDFRNSSAQLEEARTFCTSIIIFDIQQSFILQDGPHRQSFRPERSHGYSRRWNNFVGKYSMSLASLNNDSNGKFTWNTGILWFVYFFCLQSSGELASNEMTSNQITSLMQHSLPVDFNRGGENGVGINGDVSGGGDTHHSGSANGAAGDLSTLKWNRVTGTNVLDCPTFFA